jgi:hypothetical protein
MIFGPRSLAFSWVAPSEETEITTYEFKYIQGEITNTITLSATDQYMSYQINNLLPDISVEAFVKASADNGETWGEEASFPSATPIDPPPEPPATAVTTILSEDNYIQVGWTLPTLLPSGISWYLVESISHGIQYAYRSQDLNDLTYTFTQLGSDFNGYFSIKTVNNAGESAPIFTNKFGDFAQ